MVDHFFKSPYQKTLYLDADTRVCEDIVHMFDLLDRFDIALAYVYSRAKALKQYTGPVPRIFLPLNGGVILFKKTDPVIELLKEWERNYHQSTIKGDQTTLRELVWLTDLKVIILPTEYNVRYKFCVRALARTKITPKILHLGDFKTEMDILPEGVSFSLRKKIKRKLLKLFQ